MNRTLLSVTFFALSVCPATLNGQTATPDSNAATNSIPEQEPVDSNVEQRSVVEHTFTRLEE